MKTIRLYPLANEAAQPVAPDVFLDNAEISTDGWALIPFGDWPHEMGLQRFHREQAEAIVKTFANSSSGIFRRATIGLPIVKGHPDHPSAAIANQYPDKEEKGQIADMEVRPDGLALRLILSNAGADLVRKGWKFISPLWLGALVSRANDALKVYAPTKMVSVGLVARPNIPVQSLANAQAAPALITSSHVEATNNKIPMNPKTLKLLGLPETATHDEIHAKVEALSNSATALGNEQTARTTAEGKATALENDNKALAGKLATTETALANERKARVAEAIAVAIKAGKITEAEKPTWERRLTADASEFVALQNAAPVVKTKSVVDAKTLKETQAALENKAEGDGADAKDACGLSNEEIDAMDNAGRNAKRAALVNDAMKCLSSTMPESTKRNMAWANAKKANPHLFGAS